MLKFHLLKRALFALLPLLVIASALAFAGIQLANRPAPGRKKADISAPRIAVLTSELTSARAIIAEVEAPFAQLQTPLKPGTFVHADIPGREIREVHQLPDSALVEGEKIWVVHQTGTLRALLVHLVMNFDGQVYVRPKDEDAPRILQVVIQPLVHFYQGMSVETKPLPGGIH